MNKTWTKPAGIIPGLYNSMINQSHVLVAGTTGSGKSVLVNGLIYSLLFYAPCEKQLFLLDPKRVELSQYKSLPHTKRYCNTPESCTAALNDLVTEMERRYQEMEKNGLRLYSGPDTYCIIDEWIDIKQTAGKAAEIPLIRLAAMARAAKIHIILCTQRPTSDIINGTIRANFAAKIALRCNSRQESRNIIDQAGAEMLPRYGTCLFRFPEFICVGSSTVPLVSENQLSERVQYWLDQITPEKRRGGLLQWFL